MKVILTVRETERLLNGRLLYVVEENNVYFLTYGNGAHKAVLSDDNKIKVLNFLRIKNIKAILS